MKNKIYTYKQIFKYLFDLLSDREAVKEYNSYNIIKKKQSGVSEDVIISLIHNLISDNIIFNNDFVTGIHNIKVNNTGYSSVIVNNTFCIEIKGISSKNGFISVNKKSYKAFSWIWIDLSKFFNRNDTITIHIVKNPSEFLKQDTSSKLSFKKVIEIFSKTQNYKTIDLNINTLNIKNDRVNGFFNL